MITRPHIVNGQFQSDKYPTCPPGKVPLSTKDPMAQDLLWQYAQRRRAVDPEFADDLEFALVESGYEPVRENITRVFKAGDVVRTKAFDVGPPMTIESVASAIPGRGAGVLCVWFEDSKLRRDVFSPKALEHCDGAGA